jgi:hypothetical protein
MGAADPVTITIADGANSLRDVRDAINDANAPACSPRWCATAPSGACC